MWLSGLKIIQIQQVDGQTRWAHGKTMLAGITERMEFKAESGLRKKQNQTSNFPDVRKRLFGVCERKTFI